MKIREIERIPLIVEAPSPDPKSYQQIRDALVKYEVPGDPVETGDGCEWYEGEKYNLTVNWNKNVIVVCSKTPFEREKQNG
jgi:hypothetical protein